MSSKSGRPPKSSLFKRVKILTFLVLSLAIIGSAVAGGGYLYFSRGLPDEQTLRDFPYKRVSEVYAEDGEKIGEFYEERRYVIPYQRIPGVAIGAVLAAEDADYFEHSGVDYFALLRAVLVNLKERSKSQGASTITMQAAKVALGLSPEKKYSRKVKQIILARRMEKAEGISKHQILGLYLNLVYFGRGAYGIEAAAREYFGKSAQDLTPAEAATLAALPQRPSDLSQDSSRDRLMARQKWILEQWKKHIPDWTAAGHNEGNFTVADLDKALTEQVDIQPPSNLNLEFAPYFVEQVRREVQERLGSKAVYEGGLRIYTTANANMSVAARQALRAGLEELDRRQGYRGPVKYIDEKDERKAWLEESKAQFADVTPAQGEVYDAMITSVSKTQATVQFGDNKGVMILRDLSWARKPNPDAHWEWSKVTNLTHVLKRGYIVHVTPKGALSADDKKSKQYKDGESYYLLRQQPEVEGALLAMDPHTGAIRAMAGGYDFEKSEYNRAFQAYRQPGSAFKPLLYSAALDRGFTPSTIIVDSPVVFVEDTTIGNGKKNEKHDDTWKPKNYGAKFYGDTTFRTALVLSRNVVSIKILYDIGIRYAGWYAQNMGLSRPPTRDLSMALGSSEVTLKDLVGAYAVFPAGGTRHEPFFIQAVVDDEGNVLEWNDARTRVFYDTTDAFREAERDGAGPPEFVTEYAKNYPSRPEKGIDMAGDRILRAHGRPPGHVIDPRTAYLMTSLLRDVVRYGTGVQALQLGRPAGGKTGTTDDENDAWFVGFTPDLAAGVWVGYDELKPLGRAETGGHAAAPIWTNFMMDALEGEPVRDFPVPPGIVFQKIDRESGKLACPDTASPVFVAYKLDTEPKEYVCQSGFGTGFPTEGMTPTSLPPGMPPAGMPHGLPPE